LTVAEWPVGIDGVVESIVTTLGPNDRWNVAALGLRGRDGDEAVTARTWGNTRTRRNFETNGRGYVQFSRDPVDFTEAALAVREEREPVLDSADAWAEVRVERTDSGTDGGTEWVEWALTPEESRVEREVVPVTNRGYYAVVEATVAASRLDVAAYEPSRLRERLAYFESVVDRCGGPREREAIELVRQLSLWDG
jgi:hypothetical protein